MYQDNQGNRWYQVQLHLHTTISDGRCTPGEAARIYKDAGFDMIAMTDHWKYHDEEEIEGLKVLSGCEYHVGASDTAKGVMHIVGVGMDREPDLTYRVSSRQEVIDGIRAAGGLPILAHPAWSLNTVEDVKALHGFEALEIYNTVSNVGQSRRPYSGYLVDLLANEGIFYPLVATDDTHYYCGEDETVSYIMVKAASDDKNDILTAIRVGEFYATQGPRLSVRKEGDKVIAECSACTMISFLSNLAWTADRVVKGKDLTRAEYQIKEFDRWVRVEVMDEDGRFAWSNLIFVR